MPELDRKQENNDKFVVAPRVKKIQDVQSQNNNPTKKFTLKDSFQEVKLIYGAPITVCELLKLEIKKLTIEER